jgi:hypothetical protein
MDHGQITLAAVGVLIGALLSLLGSWLIARSYFKRQRDIDTAKEELDVHLAYERLIHSFYAVVGKRPKNSATRIAMSEFGAKLKVYNRAFNAIEIQEKAIEQAAKMIQEHPEDFEDIPK